VLHRFWPSWLFTSDHPNPVNRQSKVLHHLVLKQLIASLLVPQVFLYVVWGLTKIWWLSPTFSWSAQTDCRTICFQDCCQTSTSFQMGSDYYINTLLSGTCCLTIISPLATHQARNRDSSAPCIHHVFQNWSCWCIHHLFAILASIKWYSFCLFDLPLLVIICLLILYA